MKNLKNFIKNEDGMGTVEVVLILVVLIALVALFKGTITNVLNTVLEKIRNNANTI